MRIETIFEMWKADSEIDKTELGDEALKIPQLHHKYYTIYVGERIKLRDFQNELKRLKLDKTEFYQDGPTEESEKLGWKLPAKGKIIKSDVQIYVDADKDIVDLSVKLGNQQEKVDTLDTIIKSINNRGYLIHSGIEWIKFTNGAN